MTDFRLGDLASSHLEKVIKKLDYKSYFRLRQTCREVREFIHNNRNISVHMEGIYALQFDWNDLLKSWALCCYKQFANIKVDGLYAVRLEMLVPPGQLIASVLSDQMLDFEKFYDYLEMNRITCDQLQMAELRLSKEQCATLLKLLKPVNIRLHSQESDLFEAVFQSKTLNIVKMSLSSENVVDAAPRLLSTFADVEIYVAMANPLGLLRKILQILCSQSVPNLRKFQLVVTARPVLTPGGLEEVLRDFNFTVKKTWNSIGHTTGHVTLPGGYFCKVLLKENNLDVCYEEGDPTADSESPYSSEPNSDSESRSPSSLSVDDDDLADLDLDGTGSFQQLYIGRRF